MLTKKLLFPAVFALAATFSTGCATTDTGTADAIAANKSIAEEALRTANSAAYGAAVAKDLALANGDAIDANSRRMGRMFGGSMGSK